MMTLSIAILGYGNAGKAFARILTQTQEQIRRDKDVELKVVAIATHSRGTLYDPQGIDLTEATRQLDEEGRFDPSAKAYNTLSAMEVVETVDYDILLELTTLNIHTGLPAADHIRRALQRKKHVVSANKGPLAWYYRELRDLAKENHVCFFFETTVMAGVPVFNMTDQCLQYCKIDRVEGIFNATTNYILKEMEKGTAMDEILRQGREQGFVEADVSMDVDGWDAAAKLTVLMNVLMDANLTPDQVERIGINEIKPEDIAAAKARGNRIKLLCSGSKDGSGQITAKVMPTEIPMQDVFTDEKLVAVLSLYTDLMGKLTILQYGLETTQTGYGVYIDTLRVIDEVNHHAL